MKTHHFKRKSKMSLVYAFLSVLLWSTVATAFKLSLNYMTPVNLLFYSSLSSLFIIGVILVFSGKFKLLFSQNKKDIKNSLLFGFFVPFSYYLVLFIAYSRLKAQEAQTLNFIWPIVISLLSIPILGQKIKFKNIFALFLSFIGVFVISTHGKVFNFKLRDPIGIFFALSSSLLWAIYWLYNRKDKREPTVKLFMNFLSGTAYIGLYGLWSKNLILPDSLQIIGSVYVGFFEMGFTFFLWLKALELSDNTSKVANLVYLTPVISLFFIKSVLGERILFSTIIGLILIITGIFIQEKF